MNSKFSQLSNDERDLRFTALILGELSSDEAAELQRAIKADPELARAFERRKQTIELVRETAAMGEAAPEGSAPLRLSDDRREKLLERFKTPAMAGAPAAPSKRQPRWLVPMSIAAILIGLLVVATGMFENSFRTQELAEVALFSIQDSTPKLERELPELTADKRVQISGQVSTTPGSSFGIEKLAARPASKSDAPNIFRLTPKDSDSAIALPLLVQEDEGKAGRIDGLDVAGLPFAETPSRNPFVARYPYSVNDVKNINPAFPNPSQEGATLRGYTHALADDVDARLVRPVGTLLPQENLAAAQPPGGTTLWRLNESSSSVASTANSVNSFSSPPADSFGRNSFETLASTDRNGEAALRNPVFRGVNTPTSGTGVDPAGGSRFFSVNEPKTQPPGQAQGAEHAQVSIAERSVFKGEAELLARRNMPVDAAGLPIISTDPNSGADTKRPLLESRFANTERIFANPEPIVLSGNSIATNSTLAVGGPAAQWEGAKRESLGDSLPSSGFGGGGRGGGGRGQNNPLFGGGGFAGVANVIGGGGIGRSAFGQRLGVAVERSAGASGADQSGANALDTPVEKKLDARQLSDVSFEFQIADREAQSVGGAGERLANLPGAPRFYANNPTESRSPMFANTATNSAGGGTAVLGVPLNPVPAPAPLAQVTYAESTRQPAEKLAELSKNKIDEAGLRTVDGSTALSVSSNTAFRRHGEFNEGLQFLPPRGEPVSAAKPVTPAPTPQPEVLTRDNAFSTFSLNVSDVSFKLAAASLEKGAMPEAASIRSEEFINAFDYRDPKPAPGAPLAFAWERARYPFAHNRDVVRFSIKTAAQGREAGKPLNIVVLLDNSGSMERADRVRIIQESLRTLAGQLKPQDKLSVVTFARTASLRVDGVSGTNAAEVAKQIGALTPEGGTNLEDALDLAYRTALRHYQASAVNRIVLLTDGAANLGNVEPSSLKTKVENYRKQGIALDCFGIGWEGFNDDLLEQLSRNGDGRYGFVNTPEEAASEFVGQLAGALRVAASDVKMQVEFNPKRVTAFRQIGYAKHQLTKEQFRDNKVDAAEIGAAESGNALYIVEPNPDGEGPIATVRARFRVPNTGDYREHEWVVPFGSAVELQRASPSLRLAATASAFSEWLASSPLAGEVTTDRLLQILSGVPETCGADPRPKKLEWMIRQAKSISGK